MRKRTSVDVVDAAPATALGLLPGRGGIASQRGGGDGWASSGEDGAGTKPSAPCASDGDCTLHPYGYCGPNFTATVVTA
jgi:hypothetical protein